jgi:hypothetical protein
MDIEIEVNEDVDGEYVSGKTCRGKGDLHQQRK